MKWSCNGCGFVEVTTNYTLVAGLKCRGCKRDINIFNTTFVAENDCFNIFSLNNDGKPASMKKENLKEEDLEKAAVNLKDKVVALEDQLNRGKALKEKKEQLISSYQFLSPESIKKKELELSLQTMKLEKAETIQRDIDRLEAEIAKLKKCPDFINGWSRLGLVGQNKAISSALTRAREIQNEISGIVKDQNYLGDDDLKNLEDRIVSVKRVLSDSLSKDQVQKDSIGKEMDAVLLVQERAKQNLECIVCLQVPKAESQVFSCREHHLMCQKCSRKVLTSCPLCRQDFTKIPATRNRLAEVMIRNYS